VNLRIDIRIVRFWRPSRTTNERARLTGLTGRDSPTGRSRRLADGSK
jgi:hypothetical protein